MAPFDRQTFGTRSEDLEYVTRPGAYALIVEQERVLTVEEGSGLFLPGGGLEGDETPDEALRRELLEETGLQIEQSHKLGRADEWVERRAGGGMHKICHIYRVEPGSRIRPPSEIECPNRWLEASTAIDELYHEVFRWLVERYVAK